MAKKSLSKKKKDANKTIVGVVLIVAMASVILSFVYFAFKEYQRPVYDSVTLCPENGPSRHLAILLDTTDPISLTQMQAAQQIITKKIHDAQSGTRVSFSTVTPDSDIRQSAFLSMCKPPTGEDASYFKENPKRIQEKYENKFLDPVHQGLSNLLSIQNSPSSPIMETIQEFITTIPDFITSDKPRELVIMSDLIQHTSSHSFYRGLNWDQFKNSGATARLARNFSGATVTVLRIPSSVSSVEVVDAFWVRYFNAQGFSRINVPVLGDL